MPKAIMCDTCKIKRASFGFEGGKKQRCKACKETTMIDLVTKKCEVCKKVCATFGEVDGKHTHCMNCKTETMVNVKAKMCEGCGKKQPFFGIPGGKHTHCADCKSDTMIVVRGKKCEGCKEKEPSCGYLNGKATHCGSCKLVNMVCLNKKCIKCQKKQPSFGHPGNNYTHCQDCKEEGMIDLMTKKCINCKKKAACFGNIGETYDYCGTCKGDTMINLKDIARKCKQESCMIRGNKKYRGYCTFCFQHLFPNDPLCLEMYCKTYETKVRKILIENNLEFIHDKPIFHSGCDCSSRRRVDFWKLIGNTILAIEVDENQHNGYSKQDEDIRYDDLYMQHSGKWIFIRFNPNKYKKGSTVLNPRMEERTPRLLNEITNHIKRIQKEENSELVEIYHLFFNSN